MVAGARWYDPPASALIVDRSAAAVTVANNAAQTSLLDHTPALPNDFARTGTVLELRASGYMLSTTAANLTHVVRWGGGVFDFASSPAIAQTAIVASRLWWARSVFVRQSDTIIRFAEFQYAVSDAAAGNFIVSPTAARQLIGGWPQAAAAFTPPIALDFRVQWSVAAVTNSITCAEWSLILYRVG